MLWNALKNKLEYRVEHQIFIHILYPIHRYFYYSARYHMTLCCPWLLWAKNYEAFTIYMSLVKAYTVLRFTYFLSFLYHLCWGWRRCKLPRISRWFLFFLSPGKAPQCTEEAYQYWTASALLLCTKGQLVAIPGYFFYSISAHMRKIVRVCDYLCAHAYMVFACMCGWVEACLICVCCVYSRVNEWVCVFWGTER